MPGESVYLDLEGLNAQLYDTEIRETVNNFRDYNVGDPLLFSDKISDISYDKKADATTVKLLYKGNEVTWPFKGDLTDRYKPGDMLSLQFTVVSEYSYDGYLFENLDYFVDGASAKQKNQYVDIRQYLVDGETNEK